MDFSKIARQLDEDRTGDGGFQFEKTALNHVLPKFDPQGTFNHVDADEDGVSSAAKTDIYQENSDGTETGYSVKAKRDNNNPVKVHQTADRKPAGLFSKLKQTISGDYYRGDLGFLDNDLVRQAIIMKFGSHRGSLYKFRDKFANGGQLSPSQLKMLATFHNQTGDQQRIKNNPYLTTEEMQEHFPQHFQALMDHLNNNKEGIFNAMVRQHGHPYYGRDPYRDHDPQPVSRLVELHRKSQKNNDGVVSIRDMSDRNVREAMRKMKWFAKGNRFYLSDEETDDTDKRMLDLYPIDKEASEWTMIAPNPSDESSGDGGPRRGDRSYSRTRQHGMTEPGHMKATMASNPEFLERFFPTIKSYNLKDNGRNEAPDLEEIIKKVAQVAPERVSQQLNKAPAQQNRGGFGGFLQKVRDAFDSPQPARIAPPAAGQPQGMPQKERTPNYSPAELRNRLEDPTPRPPSPLRMKKPGAFVDDRVPLKNLKPLKPGEMPLPDGRFISKLNPETREALKDAVRKAVDGGFNDSARADYLVRLWRGENRLSPAGRANPDSVIMKIINDTK